MVSILNIDRVSVCHHIDGLVQEIRSNDKLQNNTQVSA